MNYIELLMFFSGFFFSFSTILVGVFFSRLATRHDEGTRDYLCPKTMRYQHSNPALTTFSCAICPFGTRHRPSMAATPDKN